jgi:hypothetical protein
LKAQLLSASIHVVISGNAKYSFLCNPAGAHKLIKKSLDKDVLFALP